MYIIRKTITICSAHQLNLSYQSKCQNLHGHNWKVVIEICSPKLNQDGMIIDFTHISNMVREWDHQNLNALFGDTNTTAENLAQILSQHINYFLQHNVSGNKDAFVSMVSMEETEGNIAIWKKD
jgi:6-pyruvoyltetrahydropterin/6-carboxytetrahydropterin synthase